MPKQTQDQEREADVQHIHTALAYGIIGNRAAAGQELSAVYTKSPRHMFAVWASLAEMTVAPTRKTSRQDEWHGLMVQNVDGTPGDINDAPAGITLAMRFLTAQANQDADTTAALFHTALEGDQDAGVEAMGILFDTAVLTAQEQIAARKAKEA